MSSHNTFLPHFQWKSLICSFVLPHIDLVIRTVVILVRRSIRSNLSLSGRTPTPIQLALARRFLIYVSMRAIEEWYHRSIAVPSSCSFTCRRAEWFESISVDDYHIVTDWSPTADNRYRVCPPFAICRLLPLWSQTETKQKMSSLTLKTSLSLSLLIVFLISFTVSISRRLAFDDRILLEFLLFLPFVLSLSPPVCVCEKMKKKQQDRCRHRLNLLCSGGTCAHAARNNDRILTLSFTKQWSSILNEHRRHREVRKSEFLSIFDHPSLFARHPRPWRKHSASDSWADDMCLSWSLVCYSSVYWTFTFRSSAVSLRVEVDCARSESIHPSRHFLITRRGTTKVQQIRFSRSFVYFDILIVNDARQAWWNRLRNSIHRIWWHRVHFREREKRKIKHTTKKTNYD